MLQPKTLKVGVVGLGNMGKHHVRNYFNLPNAELVAICDLQTNIVNEFSEKYKCNGYTDLDAFINHPELDAVSITSPTKTHFTIAKKILSKGISTLVEKPICDSLEDAQQLIDLAKEKHATLMVGHIERFNPAVIKLKEIIDSGELGKITSLVSKRVGVFPAQIKDANVIIDLAVHDIDMFSYLLNKQPTNIQGNAGKALISDREDYADIFLTYGDQNGFIQVNWITPIRIRNLSITGTKGYAELNYMTQELTTYESNYHKDIDNFGDYIIKFGSPTKHVVNIEKEEPLKSELSHFIESVKNKSTPLISGNDGKAALDSALKVMDIMKINNNVFSN